MANEVDIEHLNYNIEDNKLKYTKQYGFER